MCTQVIGAERLEERQWGHLELCQLQGQLNEGVRAGPAFLDQPFPKLSKQAAVEVHVVGYTLGREEGRLNDTLALRKGKKQAHLKYFFSSKWSSITTW